MEDFKEALDIFMDKYGDIKWPFGCEHDILYVTGEINPDDFSKEEKYTLQVLGFEFDEDLNQFYSFKFGSM